MVTYLQTTYNKFETPSGAVGEAPDGPGSFKHLSDQLDARLSAGGAEICANLAAINAISGRLFEGKTAFASDTKYRYRYTGSAWVLWSTPWTAFASGAFASGVVSNTFGYAPAWKIVDGDAVISGGVKKSSGAAFADGDSLLTLPSVIAPANTAYYLANASSGGMAGVQVNLTAMTIHSVKGSAPIWIALDGWTYRIQ